MEIQKILLMYTNDLAREMVQPVLESMGYQVTPTEGEEKGFREVGDEAFVAVLFEAGIDLAGVSEVARKIKRTGHNVPVIALFTSEQKKPIKNVDFASNIASDGAGKKIGTYLRTLSTGRRP